MELKRLHHKFEDSYTIEGNGKSYNTTVVNQQSPAINEKPVKAKKGNRLPPRVGTAIDTKQKVKVRGVFMPIDLDKVKNNNSTVNIEA